MKAPGQRLRFDRGARWLLVLMLLLVALAVSSAIYRFTLPTDGWLSAEPDDFNTSGFIYHENLMGQPSGLQPGDLLVAIEGIPLTGGVTTTLWQLKDEWQAGTMVRYTIQRGEEVLELDVPLTNWQPIRYLQTGGITPTMLVAYVGIFIFLAMGLLAFWRRPDIPAARALWVLSAVTFSIWTVTGLFPSMVPDSVDPLASVSVVFFIFATFTILLPPAFIRFALVFPKPKPMLLRHPWIGYLPYVVGLIGLGAFLMEVYVFGWVWTAASVFIALVLLIHNGLTMRDKVSRAQMRWGLGGLIVGLGLFFSSYIEVFTDFDLPFFDVLNGISALGFGIAGIALGIAVLRYRLFDIDVIIRKTLIYAVLTGLLALVYLGVVVLLQAIFEAVTGQRSPLAIVVSTLLIAALFAPLRQRVQSSIDRRFFRRKYDAEQVLARFAETARDEVELERLTAELVRVTRETVQPVSVTIWLKERDR